jgi:hypothetical protein
MMALVTTPGWKPPDDRSLIRGIDRIARRQRSLITSSQLRDLGLGPSGRYWARAGGRLTSVRRGVYVLPGAQFTWETAVLAAVLAAGPDAVASHMTAACLWDLFDGSPAAPGSVIHLSGPKDRRLEGVVLHRGARPARERSRRWSVPVTSVARTLFDLASVLDAGQLGRCTDEALRRSLLDLRELRGILEVHAGGGRRRLTPLRQVLSERGSGYDPGASKWEKRMDRLWDELGLPAAKRQYPIVANGTRRRVDRAIPELRLAVEWVGKEYHGQVGRFGRDRLRISDLVQCGWDVLEVTPGWTATRLRATVLAKVAERRLLFDHQAS